jgi:hypothetical protein
MSEENKKTPSALEESLKAAGVKRKREDEQQDEAAAGSVHEAVMAGGGSPLSEDDSLRSSKRNRKNAAQVEEQRESENQSEEDGEGDEENYRVAAEASEDQVLESNGKDGESGDEGDEEGDDESSDTSESDESKSLTVHEALEQLNSPDFSGTSDAYEEMGEKLGVHKIYQVIIVLLEEDEESGTNDNFANIKGLIERADEWSDFTWPAEFYELINKRLEQAVLKEKVEEVQFLVDQGASKKLGRSVYISDDSKDSEKIRQALERSFSDDESSDGEETPESRTGYGSREENEDPDNPDPYPDSPTYSSQEALSWIKGTPIVHGNVEDDTYEEDHTYADADEPDYESIQRGLSDTDYQTVVNDLLEEDLDEKMVTSNLAAIKKLREAGGAQIENTDLLTQRLRRAIAEEDTDAIDFSIKEGANKESGIQAAIDEDSFEMLDHLEPEIDQDYVVSAAENEKLEAVRYFLNQDFRDTHKIILKIAIEKTSRALIETICDQLELDQVYDVLNDLIKKDGAHLIPIFIDHIGVQELLTEIDAQDDDRYLFGVVFDYAKNYLSETEQDRHKIYAALSQFDPELKFTDRLLYYPREEFDGHPILKSLRDFFDKNVRLSNELKLAANAIGIPISTFNSDFADTPYHPTDRKSAEHYFRSERHPFTIFARPHIAQYEPHTDLPESIAATGGDKAHVGSYRSQLEVMSLMGCYLYLEAEFPDLNAEKYRDCYIYIAEAKKLFYVDEQGNSGPITIPGKKLKNFEKTLPKVMAKLTDKHLGPDEIKHLITANSGHVRKVAGEKQERRSDANSINIREPHSGFTCNLYDESLRYRCEICDYIENKFIKTDKDMIRVGAYNNYPCLMIFIERPKIAQGATDAALEAWTQLVISYYTALVNHAAQESGLPIGLDRRSSFGFLTPTISPCGQSFRINVGLIPREYADILVACLEKLNRALVLLNQDESGLDCGLANLPDGCFLKKSSEYKRYLNYASTPTRKKNPKKESKKPRNQKQKTQRNIPEVKNNILQLMWAKIDRGTNVGTGAHNLTRTPVARDSISAYVYEALQRSPQDDKTLAQIFVNGLREGVGRLELTDKKPPTLTFNQPETVEFKRIKKSLAEIKDEKFFAHILKMLDAVKRERAFNKLTDSIADFEDATITDIENCLIQTPRTIRGIHYGLAGLNEILFARAIFTCPAEGMDGFGSESEDELPSKNPQHHLYTKKLTVQNGMRSILASLHSGASHLLADYADKSKDERLPLFLHGAYFETADAVKLMAKFKKVTDIDEIGETEILIYDINTCEVGGCDEKGAPKTKKLTDENLESTKVMIIDVTSSTSQQQAEWVEKFKNFSNAEILFLVQSGLKNQQGGSDKNPYGTIRIFTKDKQGKDLLTKFMDAIRLVEKPVQSKVAHHFRRLHKRLGNVPTIRDIFRSLKNKGEDKKEKKAKPPLLTSHTAVSPSAHNSATSSATSLKVNPVRSVRQASASSSTTPLPIIPTPSPTYWYEDSEMNKILELAIAQQRNKTADGRSIHILGPLDNISYWYGLSKALEDHKRKSGIVLIPFNLSRLHWVGLVLEYDKNGYLIKANYYDSLKRSIPDFLNRILKNKRRKGDRLTEFTAIRGSQLIQQKNGHDCGPCTIENLLAQVRPSETASTNPLGRRSRHLELLRVGDPRFYASFARRQQSNQSSFLSNMRSKHKLEQSAHFSTTEYEALLSLALEILNLPTRIQIPLINALQPAEKRDEKKRTTKTAIETEEHATQLNRIRTVLNSSISDPLIQNLIAKFFYLPKDVSSLATARLRLDYNQLSPLAMMLSLPKDLLESDFATIKTYIPKRKETNSPPSGVKPLKPSASDMPAATAEGKGEWKGVATEKRGEAAITSSNMKPPPLSRSVAPPPPTALKSSRPSTSTAPVSFSPRTRLYQPEDKNAPKIKSILAKDFEEGAAYDKGDCFFDSVAQGLEAVGKTIPGHAKHEGYKKLRVLCNTYVKEYGRLSPTENWPKTEMDEDAKTGVSTYQDCLSTSQHTQSEMEEQKKLGFFTGYSTFGRPHIEGRIICEKFDVELHIVELIEYKGTIIVQHTHVNAERSKQVELEEIDLASPKILHVAIYKDHYTSIFSRLSHRPALILESVHPTSMNRASLGIPLSVPAKTATAPSTPSSLPSSSVSRSLAETLSRSLTTITSSRSGGRPSKSSATPVLATTPTTTGSARDAELEEIDHLPPEQLLSRHAELLARKDIAENQVSSSRGRHGIKELKKIDEKIAKISARMRLLGLAEDPAIPRSHR